MKKLYLFTNHYPFSHQENFLEDEIHYLSSRFDRVIILPFGNDKGLMRSIPSNCEVCRIPISKSRIGYVVKGMFHPRSFGFLVREFFRNRVFLSKKRLFSWGASARYLNNCLYNKSLKKIIGEVKKEDVCYFYWGIGQCLLSLVLKGRVHLVSRFHGAWDLWEESYGNFHSLRADVAKRLDKAVFISQKGEDYFKHRYPYANTITFPLGSRDYGEQLPSPQDGIIRVISCSTVYPLKRVHLVFDVLNSITDHQIEWTHIGAGSSFEELKAYVYSHKKNHIQVKLMGMLSHGEVMDYYKNHHFDLFINLSTSEGVPVSIMEAMSFGIPIVATDVGSTSDEVSKESGELVPPDPTVEDVVYAVRKVLGAEYSPRNKWAKNFNAATNYSSFADMLYEL